MGGVGYRVLVPLGALRAPRSRVRRRSCSRISTCAKTRMVLYGFPTRDERDTFEVLIGATGVGPKLALAMLSVHSPASLRRALFDDDLASLTLVPGVGKRTAQRLLVELKSRLDVPDFDLTDGIAGTDRTRRGARRAHRARLLARRGARGGRAARRRRQGRRPAARGAQAPRGREDLMSREEVLKPAADPVEMAEETSLRPRRLDEFVGQPRLKEHLEIMLGAARGARPVRRPHPVRRRAGPRARPRSRASSPPSSDVGLRITSGPALERAGDLAAILTNLDDGDVLFIDEIHRLPRPVEEVLYPAMEDFQLDIVIGKGPSARSIRLELPRFTLVGATTRTGLITGPLRDRFGFVARLDYYDTPDLVSIVERTARHPRRAARGRRRDRDRPAGPRARPASPTAS